MEVEVRLGLENVLHGISMENYMLCICVCGSGEAMSSSCSVVSLNKQWWLIIYLAFGRAAGNLSLNTPYDLQPRLVFKVEHVCMSVLTCTFLQNFALSP